MNVSYEILMADNGVHLRGICHPFYCLFLIVRGFLAVICDQFT